MKILFALLLLGFVILLSGCAEQPLMTDEEYKANKGPAPYSPDYSSVLPRPSSLPPGWQ
jgi:hypothetical protein